MAIAATIAFAAARAERVGGAEVVVVVRAGAAPSRLSPAARRLAERGSIIARVDGSNAAGDESGPAESRLARRLFPAPALEALRARGGATLEIDPAALARQAIVAAGAAARRKLTSAEAGALARLQERFGVAPEPAAEEVLACRRFREILGVQAAAGTVGTAGAAGAGEDGAGPAALDAGAIAQSILRALEKGARLVIVADTVPAAAAVETIETAEPPAERALRADRLLESIESALAARKSAHLVVIDGVAAAPGGDAGDAPEQAMAVLVGPAIQDGWVVVETIPAAELTAFVLRLAGDRAAAGDTPLRESLHDILRP